MANPLSAFGLFSSLFGGPAVSSEAPEVAQTAAAATTDSAVWGSPAVQPLVLQPAPAQASVTRASAKPPPAPPPVDLVSEDLDPVSAEFLTAHNRVRATVGVTPLKYQERLAESAQAWTDSLVEQGCAFRHTPEPVFGENLWWSSYFPRPNEVVDAWAAEVEHYNYRANRCDAGEMCGHYTQVVWANTTAMGCGASVCEDDSVIWACHYDPPGNWVKQRPY